VLSACQNVKVDFWSKVDFLVKVKMVTSLKLEDRLDGATNFRSWKARILFVLDENEIQKYVKEKISEPESDEEKAKHKRNEAKTKIILIDSVRDHLIPHIAELKTAKEMFDALVGLFEGKNTSRKLALRNQLRCIMMSKQIQLLLTL
jgi:hypothetical protein